MGAGFLADQQVRGVSLEEDMRENPDGFPSSPVGFAEGLLPFRYKDLT
jgi:hypothetical protein